MPFRALLVEKDDAGFRTGVTMLDEDRLPPGDVTVRVEWSSVNYKDGLACTPDGRVVTAYPMVPGIDLAGRVTASDDARFAEGDAVLLTGYDAGVGHFGGFAEVARVPGDWLVPLPDGLDTREAMALGTAGFTAALSIDALERHGLTPDAGPVIVTGATGGVGSTAVAMLAARGYTVAASTGKAAEHDYLRALGATRILDRAELAEASARPLQQERWAGAVDPVGGSTTATLIRTTRYGGAIALSGLTGGTAIETSVYPFILRGVSVLGIDSVQCPMARRAALWQRLATDLKPPHLLDTIAHETTLDGVLDAVETILAGRVRGRTLVRLGEKE